MRRCARCGEEKPTSEFNWKNKEKGWLVSYCKPCVREHSLDHYAANKVEYRVRTRRNKRLQRASRLHLLVQYLESHPCVDCGETDPLVLEFDHLRDKMDPIIEKVMGSEEQRKQLAVKRLDVREILGTKTMREITLK